MDLRVDFLGHFCFSVFSYFIATLGYLHTSVSEINMNTPDASRGFSRTLGSISWGVERLWAATEQEITFEHEDQG